MIDGVHVTLFASDAERARGFFRDALGWEAVDAGGGWLIFATPPAEVAAHPTEGGPETQLYLMCDDIAATLDALRAKGVEVASEPENQGFGVMASIVVPGFGPLGIYEPRHPRAG